MQRFFVSFPLSIDVTITDKDMYHQLTRVLRIQLWQSIVLFDGDGSETEYEVSSIDKKSISLRWKWRQFPLSEPKKSITLFQAMPNKYEKIEFIIQKWVEVGISRFIFFRSDRSQKLILTPSKIDRFKVIGREAVEQCWWVLIPEVSFVDTIKYDNEFSHNIVLDTTWQNRSVSEYSGINSIGLWVWPEGWWSDSERSLMIEKGFIFARFGQRVLRTETAGTVTAFAILHA